MTYIGVGRRFVAWFIDSLITGLAWIAFAETESPGDGTYQIRWEGADFVFPLLLTIVYFVALEAALGATVGKLVVGIRVRSLDGSRIGLGPALVRNLARVVDALPYVIPYLVGGIAVIRSETRQRLGDRWAGTVVILVGTEPRVDASTMATAGDDLSGFPSPPGTPPMDHPLPPPPPGER
jgi:uncharacterized RDD family membrane protein YckC